MLKWPFRRKTPASQKVTAGRFEIERDGEVAYLEYSIAGKILGLIHTEVPEKLRGTGLATKLADTAFRFARENHMKVDIICPVVQNYIAQRPEYSDLILY
jgi:uncharacterized protein